MKRLLTVLLLLLLTLSLCLPVAAEQTSPTPTEIADGIVAYLCESTGAADVQQWASETLPGMIGAGGEWYAIALRQRGTEIDFSAYAAALAAHVKGDALGGAVAEQRFALALLAVGGGDHYIAQTAQTTVGAMGHMSLVYGLHLLNNGIPCDAYTTEQLLDAIVAAQLSDGGFAVSGSSADPDVTAMTLQALAPHRENKTVAAAIDRALATLSALQQPEGDFISYGVPCPESGAQVVVALAALGVPVDDARFVKNDNTLVDGMLRYRLPDGSFSHIDGGESNVTATVQCFYAMVALERAEAGKSALYDIERTEGVPDLTLPEQEGENADGQAAPPQESGWLSTLHPLVRIGVVLLALVLVAWLVYVLCERCTPKQLISILIVLLLVVAAVLLIDIKPADEYYSGEHKQKDNPIGTVTLTVLCDTVIGREGTDHLPENGVILKETTFEIEQGETVFDILTEAAAAYGLRLNHTGVTATSGAMAYISGINDLSEFDHGSLSGWTYLVNDQRPSIGCGEYVLAAGDRIVFRYSLELGDDLR